MIWWWEKPERSRKEEAGFMIENYAAKTCRSLWRSDSVPFSWGPLQGAKQQRWLRGRQFNSEKKAALYLSVLGGVTQKL